MVNPWPRRIFWLILAIFVLPPLLFLVLLMAPWFVAQTPVPPSQQATWILDSSHEGSARLLVDASGAVTLKSRHVAHRQGGPKVLVGSQLDSALKLLAANDPHQSVFVESDPKAPRASVDRLVRRCEQAGLKNVLIVTQGKAPGS